MKRDDHSSAFNVKELLSELVLLYHQAALVCDAINVRDTSRVFSSSQVHNDHELGQTVEFTTNTPLACTLRQLNEHLMSYLSVKEAQSKRHNAYKVCNSERPRPCIHQSPLY